LIVDVSDDEDVTYNDVAFTMRLRNDVQQYGLSRFEYYTYEVDMEEVL